jgi:hypothetical protein
MKRSIARVLLVPVVLTIVWATTSEYLSAKKKFEMIQAERLRPGSKVTLSSAELNAWVATEIKEFAPAGVRDPKLELGNGTAAGSALIDFVKVRQSQGAPPSWILEKLLGGERPVKVWTHIRSQAGQATVDVDRVEVAGIPIEGQALDFLIQHYLYAYYPDAKVGRPFQLEYRIDRLDIGPKAVGVFIR